MVCNASEPELLRFPAPTQRVSFGAGEGTWSSRDSNTRTHSGAQADPLQDLLSYRRPQKSPGLQHVQAGTPGGVSLADESMDSATNFHPLEKQSPVRNEIVDPQGQ
ncbi:hypothetical protein AOLI_G00046440 [Acnodon oligacanthus]